MATTTPCIWIKMSASEHITTMMRELRKKAVGQSERNFDDFGVDSHTYRIGSLEQWPTIFDAAFDVTEVVTSCQGQ